MSQVRTRFDVVAARKYQLRNGEEKTHWINVGEAAQWDDGGITLRLHAIPCGNWFDGTLKLFERKDRDSRPAEPRHKPVPNCPQDDQGNAGETEE